MTTALNRWLPSLTLLTWSGIMLHFWMTGRVKDVLVPAFRPWVLVAALVLLALAVCRLFARNVECCEDETCAHSTGRTAFGKCLVLFVLLVPITVAALFSPESYSASVIQNRGVISDASALGVKPRNYEPPLPTKDGSAPAIEPEPSTRDYIPRSPQGNLKVEVVDLLYAAQDPTLRKDFENQAVEVLGQIMPATMNNPTGRRFKVVRMFMVCCAADARPIAVLVDGGAAGPSLPEMTWVKVTGRATFPMEDGRNLAVLEAEKIEESAPPEESMLY